MKRRKFILTLSALAAGIVVQIPKGAKSALRPIVKQWQPRDTKSGA